MKVLAGRLSMCVTRVYSECTCGEVEGVSEGCDLSTSCSSSSQMFVLSPFWGGIMLRELWTLLSLSLVLSSKIFHLTK